METKHKNRRQCDNNIYYFALPWDLCFTETLRYKLRLNKIYWPFVHKPRLVQRAHRKEGRNEGTKKKDCGVVEGYAKDLMWFSFLASVRFLPQQKKKESDWKSVRWVRGTGKLRCLRDGAVDFPKLFTSFLPFFLSLSLCLSCSPRGFSKYHTTVKPCLLKCRIENNSSFPMDLPAHIYD